MNLKIPVFYTMEVVRDSETDTPHDVEDITAKFPKER